MRKIKNPVEISTGLFGRPVSINKGICSQEMIESGISLSSKRRVCWPAQSTWLFK